MKRTLFYVISGRLLSKTLLSSLLLLFLLTFGLGNKVNAQTCRGPYQAYHSSAQNDAALTSLGWAFTNPLGTTNFVTNATNPVSGRRSLGAGAATAFGAIATSPTIATPSTIAFFIRKGSAIQTNTYIFEISDDNGVNWDPVVNGVNTIVGTYNTFSVTATVPAMTITYQEVTVSRTLPDIGFPASPVGYKFRIRDGRTSATAGALFFDDISWTSTVASQNVHYPAKLNETAVCTITVPTTAVYYSYDVGGDLDTYTGTQDNRVVFTPADNTYKIRATLEQFQTTDAADYLQLYNDATFTTQVGTNRFGTGYVANSYNYTSTDANGSLGIRFVSNAGLPGVNDLGYRIRIEAVRCAIPTAFNGVASSTSASLRWNSVEPNFDIHYNTTGVVPNAGSTVNDVVLGTPHSLVSPHVLTGLAPSTQYYIWVRSNCGAENSDWVGPVTITTLCSPFAVTTSTPYIENFNGLAGPLPVCTFTDAPANWATNFTNGNLFSNGVGTNFYTIPLLLTAGELYRVSYDYSGNTFGETSLAVEWGTTSFAPGSVSYTGIAYHGYFEEFVDSNIVNFTAPTTGTYYIRFYVDDITDPSGVLNLDNIKVEVETCLPPTFDTTSPVAPAVSPAPYVDLVDDFGATITWNLPVTGVPSNGYLYFISTTPIAPAFNSVANGSATGTTVPLTGLTPNTRYYVWVRSNCGAQISTWSVRYVTFVTTNVTTPTTILISQPQPASPTFTVGCNFSFFDSGGASGNYLANNETYQYTFKPTTAGSKLRAVFSSFSTENNYDGLMIYSGDGTAGNALSLMSSGRAVGNNAVTCPAGAFSGTASPGTIVSTAANGSLTFIWRSDVSLLFPGWSANITCVTVPRIDSFDVTNNSCGTGAGSPVVITGFNFTGATGVFFGGVPAASFTINSGTQITAIIPAGAQTGVISVANATATGFSTGIFTAQAPPPVTTGASICPGGTGTITSSTDCSGFLNAVTTIPGNWDASNLVDVALRPVGSANSTTCNFSAETRNFHAIEFQVSLTGTYVIEMASAFDGMGYITTGAFTPGSCATGTFIIGDDDSGAGVNPRISVLLTAGVTYTLYSTTWSLTSGAVTDSFTWAVQSTPVGGSVLLYSNSQIRWYSTNNPLSPQYNTVVATGVPFNPVGALPGYIPNTNTPGNYTYYAACSSNPTCRTATVFEIRVRPIMSVPAAISVCSNIATPLTVTGDADTYLWSSSAAGTLFNDAAGLSPYIGANVSTVYVKATSGATITVVGTNTTTLCTTTVTTTVTLPTSTWDGVSAWTPVAPDSSRIVVFDGSLGSGNFSSSGNINACSVNVINGATVLFNTGDTLEVQNAVTVAVGSTLEFDDRASLLQTNDVINAPGVYSGGNTGNIIYRRNTTPVFKLDYTYWSMPVYPQTITGFSPTSAFAYSFNSSLATPAWQNTPFSTPLIPGKGYIVRAPSSQPQGPLEGPPSPVLTTFNAVPNNGSISVPVYGTSNQMNLIGNPYPSAIDIERFLIDTNNDPLLQGTVYLWTHNSRIVNGNSLNYSNGDYALFNFTGPLGTGLGDISGTNPGINMNVPTKYIAAGQSFFIKGSANGTAVFNNSMRVSGNNNNFYRMSDTQQSVLELEKNRYWLDIYNANSDAKQILVGYIETATNGIDTMFDGDLVPGAVISMYTTAETKKLSIQGRALPFNVEEQLPLGYKSTIASSYTIRLSDFDGLFTSQNIYLEDKVLNVIHDLKSSNYTFTTDIGTFEDRFVLRYTTSALTIGDVFNSNSVVVYKNDEGLFVNTGLVSMDKVTIYDIRGRMLASKNSINATDVHFASLPQTEQVLLVRVEDQDGNVVTKKVVY